MSLLLLFALLVSTNCLHVVTSSAILITVFRKEKSAIFSKTCMGKHFIKKEKSAILIDICCPTHVI